MNVYWAIIDWLHLLAVTTWIGGLFFYILVLVPSLQELEPPQAGKLVGAITKRYVPITWGSLVVLIVTGILISKSRGVLGVKLGSTYGVMLFIKHLLTLVMIVNGIIISAVIGPKLKPQVPPPVEQPSGPPAGPPPQVIKLRKLMAALGKLQVVFAVLVLFSTGALTAV